VSDLKHYGAVALILLVAAGLIYINPLSGGGLTSVESTQPAGGEATACDGTTVELPGAERELLELHNEVRAEHGATKLCYQQDLAQAARRHSEDMLARDYFAHESPNGRKPADRMLAAGYGQAGYTSWRVAENLYKVEGAGAEPDLEAIEGVVKGWMESPGHRENLLNPELR
jgi:uncharacterized protein YkwD